MVKNLPAKAGDAGNAASLFGSGRFPGGGNGNPLQYSCLENPHGQRSLAGYSPRGPRRAGCDRSDFAHMGRKSECAGKVVEVI